MSILVYTKHTHTHNRSIHTVEIETRVTVCVYAWMEETVWNWVRRQAGEPKRTKPSTMSENMHGVFGKQACKEGSKQANQKRMNHRTSKQASKQTSKRTNERTNERASEPACEWISVAANALPDDDEKPCVCARHLCVTGGFHWAFGNQLWFWCWTESTRIQIALAIVCHRISNSRHFQSRAIDLQNFVARSFKKR